MNLTDWAVAAAGGVLLAAALLGCGYAGFRIGRRCGHRDVYRCVAMADGRKLKVPEYGTYRVTREGVRG